MPKQKRWELKRKCEYIESNLMNNLEHLGYLFEIYHPNYPDYYPAIQQMIEAHIMLRDAVTAFKDGI